jgi:uncharacterized protein
MDHRDNPTAAPEQQPNANPPPASPGQKKTIKPAACEKSHLPQTGLKMGHLRVPTFKGPQRMDVEICQTPRQRQIGMMCREHIDPDHGMLFIFRDMKRRSFWMKNTLIPLDIIYIDDEGRIVAIEENATPLSLQGRSPLEPAKYVLEIGGGQAAKRGVKVHQWIDFAGVPGHPEGAGDIKSKRPKRKPK